MLNLRFLQVPKRIGALLPDFDILRYPLCGCSVSGSTLGGRACVGFWKKFVGGFGQQECPPGGGSLCRSMTPSPREADHNIRTS